MISKVAKPTFAKRRGLGESLEQYAARVGLSERAARIGWRAQGLAALFSGMTIDEAIQKVAADGLRIAPGVEVPIKLAEHLCEFDGRAA